MAEGVQIEAVGARKKLEALDVNSRQLNRDLKKILRSVIMKARSATIKDAKGIVGTGFPNSNGDPRQAYKAIRSSIYKRILGGQINIISPRKASQYRASTVRKGVGRGHYGGNRRARSERSTDLDSYWGKDRGFILRFLNDGTKERKINGTFNNPDIKKPGKNKGHSSYENRNTGRRGRISGRSWFGPASQSHMMEASEQLSALIDQAIQQVWAQS